MQNFKYTLGLDLGVSSVGWSVVEIDEDENIYYPKRLIRTGVRAFSAAETPKEGYSLNKVRREARSSRKRLRRRRARLNELKKLLVGIGFIGNRDELNTPLDPWEVRSRGLDEKLTKLELAKAVLHIAKHRGFKSNRKKDPEDGGGKFAEFIKVNKEKIKKEGYRTYGEMLFKDPAYKNQKRNKGSNYLLTIDRKSLRHELELILDKQSEYYTELDEDTKLEVFDITQHQLPFASGDQILGMVGTCEFIETEKRAAQSSYTFETFRIWQFLNNTRIKDFDAYTERPLTSKEKEDIIERIHEKKTPLTYANLRKLLKLNEKTGFKELGYLWKDQREKIEKQRKLPHLTGFHTIRKSFEGYPEKWENLKSDTAKLDDIAWILSVYKTDEDISEALKNIGIDEESIDLLLAITNFNGFGHLSIKAMNEILPFLKEGKGYYEACKEAGFGDKGNSKRYHKLPVINTEEVCNPVVLRALTQARKVVNAVIDEYGPPSYIHIELARDLGKPRDERNRIKRLQDQNFANNQKLIEQLQEEFDINKPSGTDILKLKLWLEQSEKCAYSLQPIIAERLFEPNYTQIDHALPYCRSLDDSYNNKVLVLSSENQKKKKLTPYEYLNGINNSNKWQNYKNFVQSLNISHKKREKLLSKAKLEPVDLRTFMERDLNDARYIAKFFKDYVEKNLEFRGKENKRRKVYTYNGRFIAELRRLWGLKKDREESNRHHALDATVVAVASFGQIQKITRYLQNYNGYEKMHLPYPWKGFWSDIKIRIFSGDPVREMGNQGVIELYEDIKDDIKPIRVSRPPVRKMTGPAHAETVYSPKLVDEGFIIKRIDVKSIESKHLENIYGDDINVISVLKEYIKENPDPNKRTYYPRKLAKKGEGPEIKKVKIKEPSNLTVSVRSGKGVAANGSMVRVDIFTKDNKYYLVPVYVHNLAGKNELPMVTTGVKGKKIELDQTYQFLFSLYPDDYFEIIDHGQVLEGYYVQTDSSTGNLKYIIHDEPRRSNTSNKAIKTVDKIRKCQISVLGDKSYITSEQRINKK